MAIFPFSMTARGTRIRATASICALLAALVPATALADGPAIGQFELKNLEAGQGYLEFQSQNAWSFGQPSRKSALGDGGERVFDENSVIKQRHALEMEMGFNSFLKMRVGIEYERERLDEPLSLADADSFGELKFDEIGAEVIGVIIPRKGDGFGLGAVVEVERPIESGEQMNVVMGPIFEYASGQWLVAALPLLVHHFGGDPDDEGVRDDKWDFAYAGQVAYTFSPVWTMALEAYGTVDRLGSTGERSEASLLFGDFDQHRLGPILYYSYDLGRSLLSLDKPKGDDDDGEGSVVTVGMGYLAGLNDNTPDHTLKLSVEVDF